MSSRLSKTQTFTKGPAWGAYTAYTVLGTVVCIPAYLAYFAVPSLRPNPKWSLYQSFTNHVTRIVFDYVGVTEYPTPPMTSVAAGMGDFVRLEPVEESLYDGLLHDSSIRPVSAGAVWVPAAPVGALPVGQFLTLHFHGGAYVSLSPGMKSVQSGPRALATELGTPVLMLDYRLACNPNGRFPAPLQDAITAYKRLLDLGVPASQVLLSGDSAGGHLVLALLRYISEHQQLPCPAGAALWSPWMDMTDSNDSIASNPNAPSDYLTRDLIAWGVREFVPPADSPAGPYFSPARHPFKTDARLFIHSGTAEMLSGAHRAGAAAFQAVPGNRIELHESANAMHDIFAGGSDMGFGQEAADAIKAAATFLRAP